MKLLDFYTEQFMHVRKDFLRGKQMKNLNYDVMRLDVGPDKYSLCFSVITRGDYMHTQDKTRAEKSSYLYATYSAAFFFFFF